jgi:hypothetical protein
MERGGEDHVAVVAHDAFGFARGTGGVNQAGEIKVHPGSCGAGRGFCLQRSGPRGGPGQGCQGRGQGADEEASQQGSHGSTLLGRHDAVHIRFGVRDQGRGAAVVEDVADFGLFRGGMDHHEDGIGLERAEQGDDRFQAVLEADADPVSALNAEPPQRVGEAVGEVVELGVRPPAGAAHQRCFPRQPRGALFEEFLDQTWLHVRQLVPA